jgi:hypothetical protein
MIHANTLAKQNSFSRFTYRLHYYYKMVSLSLAIRLRRGLMAKEREPSASRGDPAHERKSRTL